MVSGNSLLSLWDTLLFSTAVVAPHLINTARNVNVGRNKDWTTVRLRVSPLPALATAIHLFIYFSTFSKLLSHLP